MDNRKVLVHESGRTTVESSIPVYTIRLLVGDKTPENIEAAKAVKTDLFKEYPYFDVTKRTTKFNIFIQFRVADTGYNGLVKTAEISMRFQELLLQYIARYGIE